MVPDSRFFWVTGSGWGWSLGWFGSVAGLLALVLDLVDGGLWFLLYRGGLWSSHRPLLVHLQNGLAHKPVLALLERGGRMKGDRNENLYNKYITQTLLVRYIYWVYLIYINIYICLINILVNKTSLGHT